MARNKEEEDYWNTSENRGFDFDGDKVFQKFIKSPLQIINNLNFR